MADLIVTIIVWVGFIAFFIWFDKRLPGDRYWTRLLTRETREHTDRFRW